MSIEIMSAVWQHSKQREGNLLVLLAIADFADDEGYAFPAIKTIGKKSRLSHRHTQRIVKQLVEAGELEIDGTKMSHKGTHLFRVTLCHVAPTSRRSRHGGDAPDVLGVTSVSPKSSLNHQEEEKTKTGVCSFDQFWEKYPVKKGKRSATTAWQRLKLDKLATTIIASIQIHIDYDEAWQKGFIPHPTTYLNQGRWEDDLTTAAAVKTNQACQHRTKLQDHFDDNDVLIYRCAGCGVEVPA